MRPDVERARVPRDTRVGSVPAFAGVLAPRARGELAVLHERERECRIVRLVRSSAVQTGAPHEQRERPVPPSARDSEQLRLVAQVANHEVGLAEAGDDGGRGRDATISVCAVVRARDRKRVAPPRAVDGRHAGDGPRGVALQPERRGERQGRGASGFHPATRGGDGARGFLARLVVRRRERRLALGDGLELEFDATLGAARLLVRRGRGLAQRKHAQAPVATAGDNLGVANLHERHRVRAVRAALGGEQRHRFGVFRSIATIARFRVIARTLFLHRSVPKRGVERGDVPGLVAQREDVAAPRRAQRALAKRRARDAVASPRDLFFVVSSRVLLFCPQRHLAADDHREDVPFAPDEHVHEPARRGRLRGPQRRRRRRAVRHGEHSHAPARVAQGQPPDAAKRCFFFFFSANLRDGDDRRARGFNEQVRAPHPAGVSLAARTRLRLRLVRLVRASMSQCRRNARFVQGAALGPHEHHAGRREAHRARDVASLFFVLVFLPRRRIRRERLEPPVTRVPHTALPPRRPATGPRVVRVLILGEVPELDAGVRAGRDQGLRAARVPNRRASPHAATSVSAQRRHGVLLFFSGDVAFLSLASLVAGRGRILPQTHRAVFARGDEQAARPRARRLAIPDAAAVPVKRPD